VTVDGIELPYYIVLIGAGVLKLTSAAAVQGEEETTAEEQVASEIQTAGI
jgi:hypothetical protein